MQDGLGEEGGPLDDDPHIIMHSLLYMKALCRVVSDNINWKAVHLIFDIAFKKPIF